MSGGMKMLIGIPKRNAPTAHGQSVLVLERCALSAFDISGLLEFVAESAAALRVKWGGTSARRSETNDHPSRD
jgi:hypothetical protein